jgi:tRNA-binding protein
LGESRAKLPLQLRGASGMPEISWEDFEKVDVRVGRVVDAGPFPKARKPSIKLAVDFGPGLGIKESSAQLTDHYAPEELRGPQVLAVVNFPPRNASPASRARCWCSGCRMKRAPLVLLAPDQEVPLGSRMF